MSIKNRLASIIFGWFPEEPNMPKAKLNLADNKTTPKPWWWTPIWLTNALLIVTSGVATYFLLDTPILRGAGGLFLIIFYVGVVCYLRVNPSVRINRAVYTMLGIAPIGFILWVISVSVLNQTLLLNRSGTWPFILACFIVCISLGAFIGNWIGKRRGYVLPMTP